MKQSDWSLAALAVTRQNTSPASMLFTLNLFLTDFSLSLFSFLSLPISSSKNGSSHWPSYMPHEKSSFFFLALILQPLNEYLWKYEYFISATADKQTRCRPIPGGKDSSMPFTAQECDFLSHFDESSSVSSSCNTGVLCKSGPHWRHNLIKHYIWSNQTLQTTSGGQSNPINLHLGDFTGTRYQQTDLAKWRFVERCWDCLKSE